MHDPDNETIGRVARIIILPESAVYRASFPALILRTRRFLFEVKLNPQGNHQANGAKYILFAQGFPVGPIETADIASSSSKPGQNPGANRVTMLRQINPESTEMLGEWHPLADQLGSTEGLISLSTASHSLQLSHVHNVESLIRFLEAYQSQILIPHELPAIQRAYRHASRHETRELISFDQQLVDEPALKCFAKASRRVGQAQLKRLRPLRDERLLQRYLRSVEAAESHGWHTLVYGLTLSVYSLPVLQGLTSYEKQTLLGFMHAVSRNLRLSENDCREILDRLSPAFPRPVEPILGSDESARTHFSF